MEPPDQFSRTFLPAAHATGVRRPAATRHLPVLRRCVGPREATVFAATCARVGATDDHLIVLTRRRLVVTAESRLLRRLRLHLNSDLADLVDVAWTPEPELGGVQLHATAIDGVREHFWIKAGDADTVHRIDRLLTELFSGAEKSGAALAA